MRVSLCATHQTDVSKSPLYLLVISSENGRMTRPTANGNTTQTGDGQNKRKGPSILIVLLLDAVILPPLLLLLIDWTIPSKIDPEHFTLPPVSLTGSLTPNTILTKAEKLYDGQVQGPESVLIKHGHIYTGTADGRILDLYNGTVRTLATLGGPECEFGGREMDCGRPLGMRLKGRDIIVVDGYLGIYTIDTFTGEYTKLMSADMHIGGHPSRFLNDLDIGKDGILYVSDSSVKWTREQGLQLTMENRPTGRVITYNPRTGRSELLIPDLYGANGLQLSPDETFLLINESPRCRTLKYHLKGAKKGQIEVFANLPGFPDNVRPSQSGGYWVAIAIVRRTDVMIPWYDFLATRPWLRRIMSKVLSENMQISLIRQFYGMIIELDQNGNVLRSFHDPTGSVIQAVSEVEDHGKEIYLGSFFAPFIAKLDLRKQKRYSGNTVPVGKAGKSCWPVNT